MDVITSHLSNIKTMNSMHLKLLLMDLTLETSIGNKQIIQNQYSPRHLR
jgi:hypothetical protein